MADPQARHHSTLPRLSAPPKLAELRQLARLLAVRGGGRMQRHELLAALNSPATLAETKARVRALPISRQHRIAAALGAAPPADPRAPPWLLGEALEMLRAAYFPASRRANDRPRAFDADYACQIYPAIAPVCDHPALDDIWQTKNISLPEYNRAQGTDFRTWREHWLYFSRLSEQSLAEAIAHGHEEAVMRMLQIHNFRGDISPESMGLPPDAQASLVALVAAANAGQRQIVWRILETLNTIPQPPLLCTRPVLDALIRIADAPMERRLGYLCSFGGEYRALQFLMAALEARRFEAFETMVAGQYALKSKEFRWHWRSLITAAARLGAGPLRATYDILAHHGILANASRQDILNAVRSVKSAAARVLEQHIDAPDIFELDGVQGAPVNPGLDE